VVKFISLRLLQGIFVLLAIYAVTFFLVAATPGSPFSSERAIRPEILAQIEAFYGYDKPVWERFVTSLNNMLHGEFGPSAVYANRTVTEIIAESFPVSLKLGSISLLVALLLGVPAGILAAVKKNTWLDYLPMSSAMAGICLPTFVMGPLLALVFGLTLQLLPVAGWFGPEFMILPAATLGLYYAAYFGIIRGRDDISGARPWPMVRARGAQPRRFSDPGPDDPVRRPDRHHEPRRRYTPGHAQPAAQI